MNDKLLRQEFDKTVEALKKLPLEQRRRIMQEIIHAIFFKELNTDDGYVAAFMREYMRKRNR
jgi:hypothetical protein